MLKKKCLVIFLFIILFSLTVSHVSAIEDNQTDEIVSNVVNENVVNDVIVDEKYNSVLEEDIIGDTTNDKISYVNDIETNLSGDYGTFNDLQSLIDKYNSITLDKDYSFDADIDDEDLEGGLDIDHDIVINGNGHTIYSNGARAFWIYSGVTAMFSNLNIVNNFEYDEVMNGEVIAYDNGGAIYNKGILFLDNCLFLYNHANSAGGAVYASEDSLTAVSSCIFKNNTAFFEGGAICSYGFLFIYGGDELEKYSMFSNCWSKYGGAISVNNGTYIYNSIFSNNNASSTGGAIYNEEANLCHVSNSYFLNNEADNGGAIYNAIALNCVFYASNVAHSNKGHNMYEGVQINCEAKDSNINNFYNTISSTGFSFEPAELVYLDGSNGKNFKVTLTSNPGGESVKGVEVGLIIDGNYDNEVLAITDEDGIVSFSLSALSNGIHNFSVGLAYDGFNSINQTFNVQVGQLDSNVVLDNNIVFNYGSSGSAKVTLTGCTISEDTISVLNYPDAGVKYSNNIITLSDLNAGTYQLQIVTTPSSSLYKSVTRTFTVTVKKIDSKIELNSVEYYYMDTGFVTMNLDGCTVSFDKASVVGHPEINPIVSNNAISVPNLAAGTYTLSVITTPDINHNAVTGTCTITVKKRVASISISSLTTYYNSGKTLSIKLMDKTSNVPLAFKQVSLNVYTGAGYRTYYATTNANGVATFKVSTLSIGNHMVVANYLDEKYDCNSPTSSVKINKITLSYVVKSKAYNDGTKFEVWVKNKATNKFVNGINIKLVIKDGSKSKTITLKTGKYDKNKGYICFATNKFSAGSHVVKITSGDAKYTGSKNSKLVIKKVATKKKKTFMRISNGKKSFA